MVAEALFARTHCFLFLELVLVYHFIESARQKKKTPQTNKLKSSEREGFGMNNV